ncbi:MAG: hypothetical protein IPJ98_07340 [Bryobacterales bacterium]|nr:hypothetical protein [Bryobacterales bacterium]
MTQRVWMAAGFCVLAGAAWMRTAPAAKENKIPAKILHAPSAQPDRVILTWAGDPKTTRR